MVKKHDRCDENSTTKEEAPRVDRIKPNVDLALVKRRQILAYRKKITREFTALLCFVKAKKLPRPCRTQTKTNTQVGCV